MNSKCEYLFPSIFLYFPLRLNALINIIFIVAKKSDQQRS